ncbi:MAG: hypothetical protein AB1505_31725, partial [Candidatus Latescibacterota bacterium]
ARRIAAPGQGAKRGPERWEDWGCQLLDQFVEQAPNRLQGVARVLDSLGPVVPRVGLRYAREWIRLEPDSGRAYALAASFQALDGDVAGARKSIDRASRLARQQGDQDLSREVADIRRRINSPHYRMLGGLLRELGPGALKDVAEMVGLDLEEDDEDWE